MTNDMHTNVKASRMRVARSRGALSGIVVVVLGAWSILVPFIGTYIQLKTTTASVAADYLRAGGGSTFGSPNPDDAWKWTTARGWLEVLPGAVAVVGGLLLLLSANRVVTSFGGWIAAAAGAWLVVNPVLTPVVDLDQPVPDPRYGTNHQSFVYLLTFFAIGAAIILFAALALGRLSVHGLGDVRAAEKRARHDAAREDAERQANAQAAAQHEAAATAERERAERERLAAERASNDGPAHAVPTDTTTTDGEHRPQHGL